MEFDIQCVVDNANELGEGPIWDVQRQRLLWVDILGKSVHAYHPESGEVLSWQLDEMIGFVVPCEDGRWIAGMASGLAYICLNSDLNSDLNDDPNHDPNHDRDSENCVKLDFIDRPEKEQPENRFNDGACDSEGRLWCGTMHMPATQALGKLYCYGRSSKPKVMDDGYIVTNGPTFSCDGRTLYHSESVGSERMPQGIYAFTLHEDGSIHNKRLLVDYRNRQAAPDGLVVDADNRLWVGEWGGAQLACFDRQGKLLQEIPLPATNVTKAAFGGKNLDVLYVTTATVGLSEEQLANEPQAGGLFEIRGVGKGLSPSRFKGALPGKPLEKR